MVQRRPSRKTQPTPPQTPPPPRNINITICGDGGCGKSSITLRLVRSQWTSDYDPTIEDSYSITRRIDGQTYHLALTDTAGQEEYRGMWAASNLKSDAFLMVYDITNRESLNALQEFNDLIDIELETRVECSERAEETRRAMSRRERSLLAAPGPARSKAQREIIAQPVKIVAGNKCDLQDRRVVTSKEGLEWARKRGCGFMETSARNTVNIEETFALIVRRVAEARRVALEDAGLADVVVKKSASPHRLGVAGGATVDAGGSAGRDAGGYTNRNTAGTTSTGRETTTSTKMEHKYPDQTDPHDSAQQQQQEQGAATSRARTAPLDPLEVPEKMEELEFERTGFWARMRCW